MHPFLHAKRWGIMTAMLEGIEKLPPGSRVLVALSGGADSVAMLYRLRDEAASRGISICAAHYEHGLRGQASLDDADFVQKLCDELRVPLVIDHGDVRAIAQKLGQGIEQAARTARYEFLESVRQKTGASCIALAHHRDDQVETILMHLLRGAGLHGVVGMKVWDGYLWRPLLNAEKRTLVGYLRDHGYAWREDLTNSVPDNPRNIIRLQALPALSTAYPGYTATIARFGELAAADDEYLEAQTTGYLKDNAVMTPVGWRIAVSEAPTALLRRAVRRLTGLPGEMCILAARLAQSPQGEAMLSSDLRAIKTNGSLYLVSKTPSIAEVPLKKQGTLCFDGIGTVHIRETDPVPSADLWSQVIDADSLEGAVIRSRRDGDHIVPFGMKGRKSLSDYLIDRHVDQPLRDILPLIARDDEILYVPGAGISEHVRLRENSRALNVKVELYMKGWVEDGTSH